MTQDQLIYSQQATSRQGSLGEQFALAFERKRLPEFLHGKIVQFSTQEVATGYDILSFETSTSLLPDRYIEVKTFRGHPHFYWTENEIAAARKYGEHYYLYLVDVDRVEEPNYEPQLIPNPALLFDELQASEEKPRFNAPIPNGAQNAHTWSFRPIQYAFSLNAESNIPHDWDTSIILLGCYNTEQHLRWILDHNLYNVRAERPSNSFQKSIKKASQVPGSITDTTASANARYLILYSVGNPRCYNFFELASAPQHVSRQQLINLGYQDPHCPYYLLHSIARQLSSFHIDLPKLLRDANPKDSSFVGTPLYLAGAQLRRFMDQDSENSTIIDLPKEPVSYSLPEITISNELTSQDIVQTLERLLSTTPDTIPDAEISGILDILPSLEKWIRTFKSQSVTYTSETGVILPGYKLKDYQWRTIPDKAAAIETIRSFDPQLVKKCIRPQDLCSLSELEKVLGKQLFKDLLLPHVKVQSALRLVKDK